MVEQLLRFHQSYYRFTQARISKILNFEEKVDILCFSSTVFKTF